MGFKSFIINNIPMGNKYDPRQAFEIIMDTIQGKRGTDLATYRKCLEVCQELEGQTKKMAEEKKFDWKQILKNATKLKKSNSGDILPTLEYLGRFTGPSDPRLNDDATKNDYLAGLECFVLTAKDYVQPYVDAHL